MNNTTRVCGLATNDETARATLPSFSADLTSVDAEQHKACNGLADQMQARIDIAEDLGIICRVVNGRVGVLEVDDLWIMTVVFAYVGCELARVEDEIAVR